MNTYDINSNVKESSPILRETTFLRENQEVYRFKSRSYQGESFSSTGMIAFINITLKQYFSLDFAPSLHF